MTITEVPTTLVASIASYLESDPRSPGLHASQIYTEIDKAVNRKRYGSVSEEDLGEWGTVGFVWEAILERVLADITMGGDPTVYFRPGEQQLDGIYLTPDYASTDGDEFRLEEWKATWKSARKADDLIANFWKWTVQIKCYLKVLGWTRCRLRVLFICGNWQPPQPIVREFNLTFTQLELDENWDMIVNTAKAKGWL